jgi:uncharacterized protein
MATSTTYPRALKATLQRDLGLHPVVVVMGARQVGKSTLCHQLAEERGLASCTLDDRSTLDAAIHDPDGLIRALGPDGAFIDEAQRAPGVFLAVKAIVDRRNRPGQYLLSGSNQPRVSAAVGDSLLGRAAYRTLRPLTLSELRFDETHAGWSFLFGKSDARIREELTRRSESNGPLEWEDVVDTGGFPRAVSAPQASRRRLLDDYVRVFASRDIREMIGIDSTERFEAFLRVTATRIGRPLNHAGLGTDLGLSVNTVRRWLDALQRSYLIELLPSYSRNAAQRVIKAPKLFAVDAALALAAARETYPSGLHLENLVATDLAVWKDAGESRAVYHWRLGTGQEVDFILEERGTLLPVEVKTSTRVTSADVRHLRAFLDQHPNAVRALLLSADPLISTPSNRTIAAPWWAVL